ncbi:ABC transporter permease [Glycomyces sp. NPDC046736]|uniref:ABC transporter permease n=1 Tax=Glycomyces sp. NPDC046736 TaxID=3155615 RepID=UPI0033FAE765
MLLLAWHTFRDRWQVFAGAVLTVCLGVALVQSSLLALVAAATAPIPPGLSEEAALALSWAYDGAMTLLSLVLGLASFVAVFIVSSTFGFAVAQRRGELALLRMTGAGRGQVRRLLVGEAILLGFIGSVLGIAVGLPVLRLQVWLLDRFELAPPGFDVPWRPWILVVSIGSGVLIAVLGVLAASWRASRVRPLEALRDSGSASRVMTASRWTIGLVFLCGAAVLFALFPAGSAPQPVWFVQITPFLVSVPLIIGFSALAPLLVPLVGGLFGLVMRGRLGEFTVANLRSDARRSASTAAPIMVLVAFTASIGGTLVTMNEAARQEQSAAVDGDLVVTTADRDPGVSQVDGVTAVSAEAEIMFELRFTVYEDTWYEPRFGLVVDPEAYAQTHAVEVVEGDLADLTGPAVAVSPSEGTEREWRVGDVLPARLDGEDVEVRIAAVLAPTVAGPNFLLSPDLAPPEAGPWQHVVQLDSGADADVAAWRLSEFGEVATVEAWVDRAAAEKERLTRDLMIVLLGLTMLYTVIAIVNAVVIAASGRRREFAAARVTGLTRGQVVRSAVAESQAVVLIGLLLGGLAASASVLGVSIAIRNLIGLNVIEVPWPLLIALAAGTAVVVAVTSAVTAWSATRTPPIRLVGARE